MNSTDYPRASLVGPGLRDAAVTVAFTRMINRKIRARETKMKFPVSLDTLIEKLDTYNPVNEIFNVISNSVDPRWRENVVVWLDSESRALKIWHVADAWQRLVVVGNSPQSISLFMLIHRMTRCKK